MINSEHFGLCLCLAFLGPLLSCLPAESLSGSDVTMKHLALLFGLVAVLPGGLACGGCFGPAGHVEHVRHVKRIQVNPDFHLVSCHFAALLTRKMSGINKAVMNS